MGLVVTFYYLCCATDHPESPADPVVQTTDGRPSRAHGNFQEEIEMSVLHHMEQMGGLNEAGECSVEMETEEEEGLDFQYEGSLLKTPKSEGEVETDFQHEAEMHVISERLERYHIDK